MRASRPRLLFLCHNLPYPPDGGAAIRSYHTLRLLAGRYDVTALCFYRTAERPSADSVAAGIRGLSSFAQVEAFPIPQESSRVRWGWDHAQSLARGRPYTLYALNSAEYRRRVRECVARGPDVVHVDSLDLASYLVDVPSRRTVCAHHNVESSLLRKRGALEGGAARRAYLSRQADLTEREERFWCPRLALNVAVSEEDRELFARHSPGARWAVVPNGVDVDYYHAHASGRDGVLGLGATTWFPNRDALQFYCTDILPLTTAARATVTRWVGRTAPGDGEWVGAAGAELTGYVDDVRPYLERAACVIVPLRVGGGTRLKILHAWAMGKAVITTSIGCEGLRAVDGENVLIRDTAAGFAAAVDQVLVDEPLQRRLGAAGRRTVEESYSWDVIGSGMLEWYERVRTESVRSSA